MPSHPVARELLRQVKVPLAAPSANKFGKVSPTRPEHVIEELGDNLFVLDGGSSECGVESTVVRLQDRMIEILRPGLVTEEKISEVLKLKGEKFQISYARSQASPGHLESHYEPKRPLLILNENEDPKKAAERFQISSSRGMELELPSDAFLAARLLYASLRELSESSVDFIFVRRTPERSGGAWRAIWDRLERASRRGGSGSSA
jgi:L-threonylcarbamoyladenylate synthase